MLVPWSFGWRYKRETCVGYKGNGNEDTANWYYATENIACYGTNGL